jgi:DNA polymerase III alpha subunit
MAALLTSVLDSADKVANYRTNAPRWVFRSCRRYQRERRDFKVSGSGMPFVMVAVKNVGRSLVSVMSGNGRKGIYLLL